VADRAQEAAVDANTKVQALKPTLPDLPAVPDVSLVTKDLTGIFDSANQTLTDIRDAASATAALPKLKSLSTKIDAIRVQFDLLPAAGQAAIGKLVGSNMESLQQQVTRILTLPDISTDVRTALRGIGSKLAGLNVAQVSKDAGDLFKSLTATLNDMSDPTAAEAALPELKRISARLDDLKQVQAQMPATGKTVLSKLIASARGPLEQLITKVLTALGADAVAVKPVLDEIATKLAAI
jgi:hypothetical protein